MNISQFLTKLKTLVYSKNEIDTKLSAVVHTSGAEDISGNKNFIDNLTRSGKNVDAIEEQGDGYGTCQGPALDRQSFGTDQALQRCEA